MIETKVRKRYQQLCIDPLFRFEWLQKLQPNWITCGAFFTGMAVLPFLAYGFYWYAVIFMALSGFLDTLDGSLARRHHRSSSKGAALDIVSDRVVEFAIVLGLFFVDPAARSLPVLLMTGSILICVTSFLVVGVFTENSTEKSFYYSPGIIERAEAFIFFAAMILFPPAFLFLSYLFSFLVLVTALVRMVQFMKGR